MASLPTGTVTFLFTDIEGSTRLLQRLDDRSAEVLRPYREVPHATLQTRDDAQSIAFLVAFAEDL